MQGLGHRPWAALVLAGTLALASCGGGGGGSSSTAATPYTVGGTLSGLTAAGLVLQDNGGDNLAVSANAAAFTFATQVATGAGYAVSVLTQPTGETCSVAYGSGTVGGANVTSVRVTCSSTGYAVGGSITGLTTGGLVLQDNGGDNLTVSANAATFVFATPVAYGSAYAVSVLTQPTGQTCSVANGSGTKFTGAVTDVSVTCASNSYAVGGSITGLTAGGLMLQDNGGDSLTVSANAATFIFAGRVAFGAAYAVTVLTQPTGEICTVNNGSGTMGAGNVTAVSVVCSTSASTVGGTVSGLTAGGLVLQDNGGDNLPVSANAATFTFAAPVAKDAAYHITVLTQPANQICTVAGGNGTMGTVNVTSVSIACSNSYTVGGTLSGLTASGLVLLDNGGDNLAVSAGAATFTFATQVASGAGYSVTVLTQPATQICTVAGGTGTMGTAPVAGVSITCINSFTVGGSITGLTSGGLVLQNNGGDNLAVSANAAAFTFATKVAAGAGYAVTALTQPTGQTCTVSGGTGLVSGANVTSVSVTCSTNTYAVGGSITGLTASGLVLQDNGGDNLTVSANAATFTFATPVAYGAAYAVTVLTQPTGQTCSVSTGSGTMGASNVTSVTISCADNNTWTWVSGSNTVNAAGNYGTKGVAAASNVPGARFGAISWTGSNGQFWLFGGFTIGVGYLNDLWKFDGANWTWVSGSSTANSLGSYGTQGVAAASNVPGGRQGALSWTDHTGQLWLFGGDGVDSAGTEDALNDLWKFDGTNWTWVSGSSTIDAFPNYGTKGVAAASNVPGSRKEAVSWTDSNGHLWLFGGWGWYNASTAGYFNDLWKFDGTNWTWISGSNTINASGSYGTRGVTAASNVPGSRYTAVSWADTSGNLWLFGGVPGPVGGYDLNDLWKFDGTNWTWVSGGSGGNAAGNYGTQGVTAASNVPGARFNATTWADTSGNLWLFGGGAFNIGYLNDLWKFDGTNWTWMSGSSTPGATSSYGTQGVPAAGNVPGARYLGVSGIDAGGRLWLFGGQGYVGSTAVYFNDLWRYQP